MKKSFLMVAALLMVGSVALAAPPAIPSTPAAVDGLVYARTVTLESGFKFHWNAEKPTVTTGPRGAARTTSRIPHTPGIGSRRPGGPESGVSSRSVTGRPSGGSWRSACRTPPPAP